MSSNKQKDAFLNYEADNYFFRNKEHKYEPDQDIVIKVIKEYNGKPKNVLEIGCNTGYRLNGISTRYPDSKVSGIEPSQEAINQGQKNYPQVNFYKGTADDMTYFPSASFDLVVIGFVLYVIDREILFKVISETDRVLADGGILMIIDFFSQIPIRNPYTHIKDTEAYTFKQNYEDILLASKIYHLMDKRSMNHSSKAHDYSNDYHDKYSLVTLRKDLTAGYK